MWSYLLCPPVIAGGGREKRRAEIIKGVEKRRKHTRKQTAGILGETPTRYVLHTVRTAAVRKACPSRAHAEKDGGGVHWVHSYNAWSYPCVWPLTAYLFRDRAPSLLLLLSETPPTCGGRSLLFVVCHVYHALKRVAYLIPFLSRRGWGGGGLYSMSCMAVAV